MLLTLSQSSTHADLGGRSTHDFAPRYNSFKPRGVSPIPKFDRSVTQLRASDVAVPPSSSRRRTPEISEMATSHRGLPPPAAMNLPDPSRSISASHPQPSGIGQPLGPMPSPPNQWQGHEDSMRNWLAAKAEEDKRKQEEERTRQETLKLEQRRIEQSMLRESLQAGVPPHMIPIIYAGIGGGALTHMSVEWLNQYAAQLQLAQQQAQPGSPDPRSTRMIGQAAYSSPSAGQQYAEAQPQALPSHPRAPTSAPRSIAQSQLPRLTTNDNFVNQSVANPGSAHPLQQTQSMAETSSPSIYFHHWVPPNESKNPQTPVSRNKRDEEPTSAFPGSHQSDGEHRDEPRYKDSARKRKAQGDHHANPPPSSAPQYGSPSFSTTSSTSGKRVSSHQRNKSGASFKDDSRSESRPQSRPDSRREDSHRLSFQVAPSRSSDDRPRQSERRTEDSYVASGAESDVATSRKEGSRTSIESQRPPPPPPPRSDQSESAAGQHDR